MSNKTKYHFNKIWIYAVGFCLFLGGLFFVTRYISQKQKNIDTPTISLAAKPLEIKNETVKNKYVGYIEAINQVQIVPYISGYLKDIIIKPGQTVKKDDLLITIEPAEYKAKADAAQGAVMQAEAAYNYAKDYYERVKKSGKRAFSEVDIDNAKNNFLQAQANLKSAKANFDLANVNLGYTQIKSPISGLIGNFDLSSGDYVAPDAKQLLEIVQTNPIRVVFSLTDKEYLNMISKDGILSDSVINLLLANGDNFSHQGKFKYTDNKFNKATNSIAVYAYFDNENNELLPNSFVTVEISKTFKDIVLIDKNYVKMLPEGNFLAIGRGDKIIEVKVHIISEKDNKYILKNTFDKNDLLIIDDTSQLGKDQVVKFNLIRS